MKTRDVLTAAVSAVGLFLAGPSARAAEPVQKGPAVIVVSAPPDRLGVRVVAELEAIGLHVVRVELPPGGVTADALEAACRPAHAIAAIRVLPGQRGIEVWTVDSATGATSLRLVDANDVAPEVDRALALRAVDLVRASQIEPNPPAQREIARPAPAPDPSPTVSHEVVAAPAIVTLRFAFSSGVLASPGGLAPIASLVGGVAWTPIEHLGFTAFTALPLTQARVASDAGAATFSALLAGAAVRVVFTSRESRWSPSADAGFLMASLDSTGSPRSGFVASDVSAVASAPFLAGGLAFAPTPVLRLRADLLVAVATEPVSVNLAQHRAATWGRPLVLSTIGADFGWF